MTEFPKEVQEKIDSIESTLREILKFTRFANISRLKEVLDRELDTDEKKIAYENSDGETILKELAAVSGAPSATVGAWWQKWFRMGIVSESEERKGRMMKIASLDDVGIKSPKKEKASPTPVTVQAQPVESSQPAATETKTE